MQQELLMRSSWRRSQCKTLAHATRRTGVTQPKVLHCLSLLIIGLSSAQSGLWQCCKIITITQGRCLKQKNIILYIEIFNALLLNWWGEWGGEWSGFEGFSEYCFYFLMSETFCPCSLLDLCAITCLPFGLSSDNPSQNHILALERILSPGFWRCSDSNSTWMKGSFLRIVVYLRRSKRRGHKPYVTDILCQLRHTRMLTWPHYNPIHSSHVHSFPPRPLTVYH